MRSNAAEPARTHYETYRRLAARSTPELAANLSLRADALYLIRHYETHIRQRFSSEYASVLQGGYAVFGQAPPSFATMTRAEAIAESQRIRQRTSQSEDARAFRLARVLEGLDTLSPDVVSPAWAH